MNGDSKYEDINSIDFKLEDLFLSSTLESTSYLHLLLMKFENAI